MSKGKLFRTRKLRRNSKKKKIGSVHVGFRIHSKKSGRTGSIRKKRLGKCVSTIGSTIRSINGVIVDNVGKTL